MTLTREQFLAHRELPQEQVPVPDLDGSIFVRVMSAAERDAYEHELVELRRTDEHLQNVRARLVAFTACDAQGNLLFTPADVEALGRANSVTLHRMAMVAARLNQLGGDE